MAYLPRIIDSELDQLMASLPAVALEGSKGVGKTETARRRATRVYELDEPAVHQVIAADPGELIARGGTVLIDEWQRYPPVWDFVRRRVDAHDPPGSYLLTGSAVPAGAATHSGAGRIVTLRMRPLSLAERGISTPTVSLAQMLTGKRGPISGTASANLRDYVDEIVRSGLPGVRSLPTVPRRAQLDGYLARIVEKDFPEQGLRIRRPQALRDWLTAYAAATATTASYNKILDAATPGETDKPSKATTIAYRDVLAQLWLLDPVPGWSPSRARLSRLTHAPKHHLADPGLAARLLGVDRETLLGGRAAPPAVRPEGTLLGALFESLVTLSVRVYAQASGASVHHMRTKDTRHEVDLIVQRDDGGVVAFEVKVAAAADDSSVEHLRWLTRELGDQLLDCAVITTGTHAYRRQDGIGVVPAALLGA